MEKELVLTDEKFIEQTTAEIQRAFEPQQKLLDCWNAMNVGRCTDLFRLIHDPINVYKELNPVEVPPVTGSYQFATDTYVKMTDVPMPNELFILAREARKCIQAGRRELWNISEDGTTVVLNQDQADALIHSRDVLVENEAQKEFIEMAVAFKESSTYLNTKLRSMLSMQSGFNIPFVMTGTGFLFIKDDELDYVALKDMMKNL